MVKRFLFLLMFASPVMALAQTELTEKDIRAMVEKETEQKLLVQCSVLMQEGFSYYAEIIADKLLTFQPNSPNYNYRKGFLMLDSHNDFQGAMKFLKVAVTDTKKNYDMYSAKEKSAAVDAFYYLGRCYHLNEQIAEATENYSKFIAASESSSELINDAKLKIKQCAVARRELDNPSKAQIINLGTQINSDKAEFSPVVSLDGSALYFASRRAWEDNSTDKFRDKRYNQYPEDIYVSYIDFDGSWIDPFRLDFCDGQRNEATQAVSADERRIYVYQDNSGNGDIYYSDFTTNRFQEIKKLEDNRINTEYWEPHCYVTTDGQNLYFTSDRPGGFGGRDIYRVVRLPDNSWSEPINLGPSVNTPYDEDAPFVAIDNKTLYFSSNGPMSMGDFDVFVTRRDEENNWSAPINLGYPINSTGDDIYYTTTVDGLRGFLTSSRKDGYGEKDIYEIKNDFLGLNSLAVLKGQIKTVDNRPIPEDVAITVNCLDCATENSRTVFPRLRDGVYFSSLDPCQEYEIIYTFAGGKREIYRERLKTDCDKEYVEIYRDITIDVRDPKNPTIVPKEPVKPIIDSTVAENGTKGGTKGGENGTKGGSKGGENGTKGGTKGGENGTKGGTKGGENGTKGGTKGGENGTKGGTKGGENGTKGSENGTKEGTNGGENNNKGNGTKPVIDIPQITKTDWTNPKYKHFFEYNGNKINPKKGDFKKFVKEIEKQLQSGRKLIAINVYSSASTVPTVTYETNEKLSQLRAENIKYDIQNYFQENTQVSDKLTVTILGSKVDGPEYKNDAKNRAKYRVYQYVEVITQ